MTCPGCLNVIISRSLTNSCFLCQLTILNGVTSSWSPSVSPRSVVSESDDVRPKIDRLFGLGEIIFGDILRAQQKSANTNVSEMSESNAAVAETRTPHRCASKDNLSTAGHSGVALLESEQSLLCLDDTVTESDSISSITDQQRNQKDIHQKDEVLSIRHRY